MSANIVNNKYSAYLNSLIKRVFDIVIGSIFIIPEIVILIFLRFVTLFYEGRPVFFINYRRGRNGILFRLSTLRILKTAADPYEFLSNHDSHNFVTQTEHILRIYRLDELPQLFSLLGGSMNLVGLRMELTNVVGVYNSLQTKRLHAKFGLSVLWQILRDRTVQMHDNIKYYLYYLYKSNLCLNINILFGTISFILKQV